MGFANGRFGTQTFFDVHDLPYFRGLADGGVKGAQQVIDAIEKHDIIEGDYPLATSNKV